MKYVWIFSLVIMVACVQKKKETVQPIDTSTLLNKQHQVKVEEVLQANAYTYMRVSENGSEYWIAVTKTNAEVGDNFYYEKGLEMKDFKSKDLDRVFESVYFISKISDSPIDVQKKPAHGGKKIVVKSTDVQIEPVEGGISIAELYANSAKYDGEKVLVRGKVVKVNKSIMSRNWIHLQDGTNNNGKFDLTITTDEEVNKGDTITIEGIVFLNKDFGSGYFYELIVEEAKLK